MLQDQRNVRCNKLADIFETYLVMEGASDYSEAKIKEDDPDEVKKSTRRIYKIKKRNPRR